VNVLAPYDVENDRYEREGQRWPWILLGGLIAVLLVVGAGVIWVQHQLDPPGSPGAAVQVQVAKGMSVADIGKLLEQKGVISNATIFRYYARLTGGASSVQAGEYTFHKNESMGKAISILEKGAAVEEQVKLTIPEGLTLDEIADKVGELPGRSADRFRELAKSGTIRSQYEPADVDSLEGLLLPETYEFNKSDDEEAILRRMVQTFDQTVTDLGIASAAQKLKITPYQAVIVASMVEREARVPEDRGPIARVIYNRLDQGMRLQIDATVLYALGEHKDTVLYSDLNVDSPYNTYKVDGLPPGPIASPGKASLQAALQPTPGPWLYYVLSQPNGKHAFATTLDEFNRLVADARARGVN
jgi:UPF0755 protein